MRPRSSLKASSSSSDNKPSISARIIASRNASSDSSRSLPYMKYGSLKPLSSRKSASRSSNSSRLNDCQSTPSHLLYFVKGISILDFGFWILRTEFLRRAGIAVFLQSKIQNPKWLRSFLSQAADSEGVRELVDRRRRCGRGCQWCDTGYSWWRSTGGSVCASAALFNGQDVA